MWILDLVILIRQETVPVTVLSLTARPFVSLSLLPARPTRPSQDFLKSEDASFF